MSIACYLVSTWKLYTYTKSERRLTVIMIIPFYVIRFLLDLRNANVPSTVEELRDTGRLVYVKPPLVVAISYCE